MMRKVVGLSTRNRGNWLVLNAAVFPCPTTRFALVKPLPVLDHATDVNASVQVAQSTQAPSKSSSEFLCAIPFRQAFEQAAARTFGRAAGSARFDPLFPARAGETLFSGGLLPLSTC